MTNPPTATEYLVPRHCTLDGFSKEVARQGGVDIRLLDPLTQLSVHTENTEYRITVLEPVESKILIQGGRFFSEPAEAVMAGASYGGNFLKMSWIGVNMRMEIHAAAVGQLIVTSPVCSIGIEDDSTVPGPF